MSAHYDLALQEFWKGTLGDITVVTTRVRFLRTSVYVMSQAHQYLSSLPAALTPDVVLGAKTANGLGADPGCLDGADVTFPAVPAGAAIDALAVYKDTGVAGTSPLLFYIDGFNVTPNGGDITVQWQNSFPFIAKL